MTNLNSGVPSFANFAPTLPPRAVTPKPVTPATIKLNLRAKQREDFLNNEEKAIKWSLNNDYDKERLKKIIEKKEDMLKAFENLNEAPDTITDLKNTINTLKKELVVVPTNPFINNEYSSSIKIPESTFISEDEKILEIMQNQPWLLKVPPKTRNNETQEIRDQPIANLLKWEGIPPRQNNNDIHPLAQPPSSPVIIPEKNVSHIPEKNVNYFGLSIIPYNRIRLNFIYQIYNDGKYIGIYKFIRKNSINSPEFMCMSDCKNKSKTYSRDDILTFENLLNIGFVEVSADMQHYGGRKSRKIPRKFRKKSRKIPRKFRKKSRKIPRKSKK